MAVSSTHPRPGTLARTVFTYQAQDGTNILGTATVSLTVTSASPYVFFENFRLRKPGRHCPLDGPPAHSGTASWVTESNVKDGAAGNAAYVTNVATATTNELVTPVITLPAGPNQLTFRNNYNLELSPMNGIGFDGGALMIKIGFRPIYKTLSLRAGSS